MDANQISAPDRYLISSSSLSKCAHTEQVNFMSYKFKLWRIFRIFCREFQAFATEVIMARILSVEELKTGNIFAVSLQRIIQYSINTKGTFLECFKQIIWKEKCFRFFFSCIKIKFMIIFLSYAFQWHVLVCRSKEFRKMARFL